MKTVASISWRRLNTLGHDKCRLEEDELGWQLNGTATYCEEEITAQLTYNVACNHSWRIQQGKVYGHIGPKAVEFHVQLTPRGFWKLNGVIVEGLSDCVDLDFNFTPATNLLQLRRLALIRGQIADVPTAWLEVSNGSLSLLQQHYERRSEMTYWYEAPRFDYAALIEVTPIGFIRLYPGLWEIEP